jgi:acetolactate synthase-1/2/3 large subunit
MIRTVDEIAPTLGKAFEIPGPVIIGVHIDYRDNHKLFEAVDANSIYWWSDPERSILAVG